jgi:hypothetical protein
MAIKPKKKGFKLNMKTFTGKSGQSYLVIRAPNGSFHVFMEVEAKDAARDCGAKKEGTTRQIWEALWVGKEVELG